MNTYRKNAVWAGILFIIGTVSGFASLPLMKGINAQDYLAEMAKSPAQTIIGAFLVFVMGTSCAGIAIALYPAMKKAGRGIALGAVGFRLMEGVLQVVGTVLMISLLTLGQEYAAAATGSEAMYQSLGTVLMAAFHWSGNVAASLAWCIGAMLYYILFYRSGLVPRWLSVWGIAGIALSAAATLLVMMNVIGTDGAVYYILHLPIMPQELLFAVWLIAKGFSKPALAALESGAVKAAAA